MQKLLAAKVLVRKICAPASRYSLDLLYPLRSLQIRQLRQLPRVVFSSVISAESSVKQNLFLLDSFTDLFFGVFCIVHICILFCFIFNDACLPKRAGLHLQTCSLTRIAYIFLKKQ